MFRHNGSGPSESANQTRARACEKNTAGPAAGGDVSGHLDSVDITASGGTLVGWAVDAQLTPGPIASTVTVRIDGAVVATALADRPRPDLVPGHVAPDPNHGFSILLPPDAAKLLLTPSPG